MPDSRSGSAPSRFAAFLSYSHASNARTGPVLESLLESFPNVWYRRRRRRIYLDRGDLAAGADLWGSIEDALRRSDHLVLLASPESASSAWVEREVAWWLQHRSVDDLVIVLTGGAIVFDAHTGAVDRSATTSLPVALLEALHREPLWVRLPDLPETGKVDAAEPDLQTALADIVALLDDVEKDELVGEHVRNRTRALRLRSGIIAGLSVLLALALIAGGTAYVQRNAALEQSLLATSRQLVAEATAIRDTQPDLARQLLVQAYRMQPTDQVIGALVDSASLPVVVPTRGLGWQVTVSPVRGLLAIAGGEGATLYDIHSGTTYAIDPESGGVRSVAFSPDDLHLAVSGNDGSIRLYDTADPARPQRVGSTIGFGMGSAALVYVSKDVLAGAVSNSMTGLWDVTDPADVDLLATFSGDPRLWEAAVAVTPDGRTLASSGTDERSPCGTSPTRAARGRWPRLEDIQARSASSHLMPRAACWRAELTTTRRGCGTSVTSARQCSVQSYRAPRSVPMPSRSARTAILSPSGPATGRSGCGT